MTEVLVEVGYETESYQNSIGCGFSSGISVIFGMLILETTWRTAYFEFVDRIYSTLVADQKLH